MAKKFDVVHGEKYTAGGEEKTKWTRCGVVFESDKGLSLKLDYIPVSSNGWFSLFEPKDRSQQSGGTGNPAPAPMSSDEIPF